MKYFVTTLFLLSTLIVAKNSLTVDVYKLKNGLTVILNPDKNEPIVYGAVGVKGGGKQDPADATGIAHYLEHMLFKGTQELGTVDYESEKVYLDSIEILYDELGNTTDHDSRLKIQKNINDLNVKASEFAIPNEFSKLSESFGGTGVNAFTSNDIIAYVSQFPPHQIGKWLEINTHRFENPVFRLFQSELETVYEEKNRSMDNAFRMLFEEFFANFFKKHPYGQQTILGTKEHLKNPSIKKMKEYYDKYYVSNNMYLMLAGDFDLQTAKEKIKTTFGRLKSGPEPEFVEVSEEPFNGREVVISRKTPIRFGMMGFRMPPPKHEDNTALNIIRNLFNNSSRTGLLDRLSIENKLLGSSAITGLGGVDHGAMGFMFIPRLIFQTFRGAENAVHDQIEKVKNGDFSEEYLQSIKLTIIRAHESGLESPSNRLNYALDMVLNDFTWEDIISYPDKIERIDKNEIVRVANKYFKDDYLVYKSKIGFPKKDKVDKPPFKPVKPKNSEEVSAYAKKLSNIPAGDIRNDFIDFQNETHHEELFDNFHFYHNENPVNSIFSMRVEYGIGNYENNKLSFAAGLAAMIGSEKFSWNELKDELQKIGATVDFFSDGNYCGLNIKGFDKYFVETMSIAGDFLQTMRVRDEDKKKLKKLIQESVVQRKFESRESSVKGNALKSYALWGDKSSFLTRPTTKEVKKMDTDILMKQIKNAMTVETSIFYVGTLGKDIVKNAVSEKFIINKNLRKSNSPLRWEKKLKNSNTVFFYNDKKAVQSQISILVDGDAMNLNDRQKSNVFNKYFGGSMSGLVFQEIREFKSLAYSAWGSYRSPYYLDDSGRFEGFMGTQADKTVDAIETYVQLLKEMPEKPLRADGIRSGLLESLNSSKPRFRTMGLSIRGWEKQGYVSDPRKIKKDVFEDVKFDDIVDFYSAFIKGKPITITIVGNKDKIDMEKLSEFGEVIELKKDDIFN
ncbi:MAG: hypothetical protein CMG41_07005 [Candidatus Marinimicrobia bacterium]|nr:hypothetical protein [Candidatus Neomarinimicrobiota bacterium]